MYVFAIVFLVAISVSCNKHEPNLTGFDMNVTTETLAPLCDTWVGETAWACSEMETDLNNWAMIVDYWDEMNNSDHSDYEDNPIGLAKMTAQGSVRKMDSITIVYGLPKFHFCGIYAHEMGHAWMWLNNYPDDISPQVKEGLCNLFEYLWLKQQHTPESKYLQYMMLQNQDRIYGNGFRLAQVKFKKYRLLQLLDYVKSHRSFPG